MLKRIFLSSLFVCLTSVGLYASNLEVSTGVFYNLYTVDTGLGGLMFARDVYYSWLMSISFKYRMSYPFMIGGMWTWDGLYQSLGAFATYRLLPANWRLRADVSLGVAVFKAGETDFKFVSPLFGVDVIWFSERFFLSVGCRLHDVVVLNHNYTFYPVGVSFGFFM